MFAFISFVTFTAWVSYCEGIEYRTKVYNDVNNRYTSYKTGVGFFL